MAENLAKLTAQFISRHQSIKECLRKGLVNHSALAREICKEHRIRKTGAVIAACRRYQARLKRATSRDSKVKSLIGQAKIRVRTKMAQILISRPADLREIFDLNVKIRKIRGDFVWIESDEVLTIITNMENLSLIRERLKRTIDSESSQLAMITLVFDSRIESTYGVVSFLYGLLAEHGINIVGETSLGPDVTILIDERELATALEILNFPTP